MQIDDLPQALRQQQAFYVNDNTASAANVTFSEVYDFIQNTLVQGEFAHSRRKMFAIKPSTPFSPLAEEPAGKGKKKVISWAVAIIMILLFVFVFADLLRHIDESAMAIRIKALEREIERRSLDAAQAGRDRRYTDELVARERVRQAEEQLIQAEDQRRQIEERWRWLRWHGLWCLQ